MIRHGGGRDAGGYATDSEQKEVRLNLLSYLLVLSGWKRFLFLHSTLWVAAAVAIALLLPQRFTSQVVLMPPKSSATGISKLAKSLPMAKLAGGAAGLLPMGSGENLENIYLAILSSRTLQTEVIAKFDLIKVYEFDRKPKYYIEDVFTEFAKHVAIEVTDEGTFIIQVWDRNAERAAQIANFMADRLDQNYKTLTVETERNQRMFLEERLRLTKIELDSAETRYTKFLVDNRMLNIDEQAKATIDAGTDIETRYLAAELKLDINKRVFAQDNPKIREQQMELNELRKQRESLMKDRKSDLLIPYRQAPDLGLQMVRLKRNLKIQEALFEFILQQYESAKFDESKNTPNVQVLDKAVAAQKRSFPKRGKIVIACAFFSLFLGIGIVSFLEYFRRFAAAKPDEFRMLQQIRRNIWGKKSAPT